MANFSVDSLSGGMQVRSSRRLNNPSFVALAQNVTGDIIGTLATRKGYTQTGNTLVANNDVLGLHSYIQLNGTAQQLATVTSGGATVLYTRTTGNWSIIGGTSFPANAEVDMFTFLDQAWIVGANSSNSYLTTGKVTNTTYSEETSFPKGRYGFVFGERILLLDVDISGTRYGSRVYYSSIATASGGTFSVNFNNTDTDFLDIRTSDGETLTGGIESYGRALLFKPSSIYAWDKKSLFQVANVGANSRKSIVNLDNNVLFLHYSTSKKGIYLWDGSGAKLISEAVAPFIEGMSSSFADNVVAGVFNDRALFYIDDVTLDADIADYYNIPQNYSNVMLEYNFKTNQWFVHTLPLAVTKISGHQGNLYFGASTGEVYQWNSGTSDDGTAIESKVRTHGIISPGNTRASFGHVIFNTHRNSSTKALYALDGGEFNELGELNNQQKYFSIGKKGLYIQFEVTANSIDGGFVLEGYDTDVVSEGRILKNG